MAEKRWFTGEEILERWQAAPFELVEAMLTGGLVAVDIHTKERFTANSVGGKCFFCEKDINEGRPVCFYRSELFTNKRLSSYIEDRPIYCGELHDTRFLTNRDRVLYRVDTSKERMFFLADVEAYEQDHGLGPAVAESSPIDPVNGPQVERPVDFKNPKEHANFLLKENPSKGLAMLTIQTHWKVKKFEAAAYVLGRELPDGDEAERRRLNYQWRYHVKLLDKGQ